MPYHCYYVWSQIMLKNKVKNIYIVGHSAGAISISLLLHFFSIFIL